MKKEKALRLYGSQVVNRARELYETNFGKVLFKEDRQNEDDIPADDKTIGEYVGKAHSSLIDASRKSVKIPKE